jgi:hypothetical protein
MTPSNDTLPHDDRRWCRSRVDKSRALPPIPTFRSAIATASTPRSSSRIPFRSPTSSAGKFQCALPGPAIGHGLGFSHENSWPTASRLATISCCWVTMISCARRRSARCDRRRLSVATGTTAVTATRPAGEVLPRKTRLNSSSVHVVISMHDDVAHHSSSILQRSQILWSWRGQLSDQTASRARIEIDSRRPAAHALG